MNVCVFVSSLSPNSLFLFNHINLIGWAALISHPFHFVSKCCVLVPVVLLSVFYFGLLLQLSLCDDGSNPGFFKLFTLAGWQQLFKNPMMEIAAVSHFFVCDLWLGRWMVYDFYTHYTSGYNVTPNKDGTSPKYPPWTLDRKILTVILMMTYGAAPVGFLFYKLVSYYWFSKTQVTNPLINPNQPQKLVTRSFLSMPTQSQELLDTRPVYWEEKYLPEPLRSLYYAIMFVVGPLTALPWIGLYVLYILYCYLSCSDPPTLHPDRPVRRCFPFVRYRSTQLMWKSTITPVARRGLWWNFRYYLLQMATFNEYIPNATNPVFVFEALMTDFNHYMNTRPRSDNGLYMKGYFPFGDGIGVGSYDLVKKYLQGDRPRKEPQSLGWDCSSDQSLFCKFTAIFLSTDIPDPTSPLGRRENPDLALCRRVAIAYLHNFAYSLREPAAAEQQAWLATHPHQHHTITTPHSSLSLQRSPRERYQECLISLYRMIPRRPHECPDAITVYHAIGELQFFLATGGELRQDERDAYVDIIVNPFIFFPDWFNTWLGGRYLSRKNRRSYDILRHAFARYADGTALTAAFKAAEGSPYPKSEVLRCIAILTCIAGGAAPAKLAYTVIQRLWEDQPRPESTRGDGKSRIELFHKNPDNFVRECARLDKAVPIVSNVATPLIVDDIKAATGVDIDPNTRIHVAILCANRDPVRFPKPNEFDPTRENLDQVIQWNGVEADVINKDPEKRPVRYCPGHDVSLDMLKFVARRFAPVLPKPSTFIRPNTAYDTQSTSVETAQQVAQDEQAKVEEVKEEAVAAGYPLGSVVVLGTDHDPANATFTGHRELRPDDVKNVIQVPGTHHTHTPQRVSLDRQELPRPHTPQVGSPSSPLQPPVGSTTAAEAQQPSAQPQQQPQSHQDLRPPEWTAPLPVQEAARIVTDPIDWHSLTPEECAEYILMHEEVSAQSLNPTTAAKYSSSRDIYLKLVMELMRIAVEQANKTPARAVDMLAPLNLPTQTLHPCRIDCSKFVANFDEDDPDGATLLRRLARYVVNLKVWEFRDYPLEFDSWQEAIGWRLTQFYQLPPPNVAYEDMWSNVAISRLAFFGLACQFTKRVKRNDAGHIEVVEGIPCSTGLEEAVFVNDQTALYVFPVRKPFEQYGAAVFFNKDRQLIAVYWSHGRRLVTPDDTAWEHAKLVWRSTAFAVVTIRDHLIAAHMIESNTLTNASRAYLSADHPLRLFLKPFTYHNVSINYQAAMSLVNDHGLVHRIWAFDYDQFLEVCDYVNRTYEFKYLCEWIDEDMKSDPRVTGNEWNKHYPIYEDIQDFWKIVHRYVETFFDIHYKKANHAVNGMDTHTYHQQPHNLPQTPTQTPAPQGTYVQGMARVWEEKKTEPESTPIKSGGKGKPKTPKTQQQHHPIPSSSPPSAAFTRLSRSSPSPSRTTSSSLRSTPEEDEALPHTDADLRVFITELCKPLGLAGIHTRSQLIDVLTQLICTGTAIHEHIGQISEYVMDPRFIATKLQQGHEVMNVQTYSQVLVLAVVTGLRMPGLLEDWSHLIPHAGHYKEDRRNYEVFRAQLIEQAGIVDQRNLHRDYPFQSFNPRFMESSVSV